MISRHRLAICVLLSLILATACSPDTDDSENNHSGAFFELVHESEGFSGDDIDHEAVRELREANTASAFRFYRVIREQSPNLIFSPLSFSRVFAGYYDGTREAQAYQSLFGYTPEVSTRQAWQQLFYQISNRDNHDDVEPEKRSTFTASDIYWVDTTSSGSANRDYFDRVHELELKAQPEQSRQQINQWVEDESHGMLQDFLPPGSINVDTEAVATNLVYFLGAWALEFNEAEPLLFQGLDEETKLPAFTKTADLRASKTDDLTVVRIPYAHEYEHWFFMPHDDFESFANALDEEQFTTLKQSTMDYEVTLTVPEFAAESKPDMVAAIEYLREQTNTDGDTLSGAYQEIYLHQAAIEVTREGTRAAAVSAVIEYGNSEPEPLEPLTVVLDKPFVHAITCSRTGSILFLGERT